MTTKPRGKFFAALRPADVRSARLVFYVLLFTLSIQTVRASDACNPEEPQTRADSEVARRFAIVRRVSGDVTAVSSNQAAPARALHEGDVLHVGERIRTGSTGEALLLTDDAAMIGVRPKAEFVTESFAARGQATDHMALRLIKGGLRVITGWIPRLNRDEYSVITPVATIGVRGTDHEPYVLLDEVATGTPDKPGSYDKVNRGATVLKTITGELQVDSGRVGFAGAKVRKRGLMTLLLPVLLDRVPGFYLGGQFEKELDEYSQSADQLIEQKLGQARAACDQAKAAAECPTAEKVAKDWISSFDAAVERRDAKGVLELFAEDVSVWANAWDASGTAVETTLTRQELADSAIASLQQLEDYSQQRQTLEARALPVEPGEACGRVEVKSFVVEQGKMAGKPYRFEAQEDYVLVRREGRWLAEKASATQP